MKFRIVSVFALVALIFSCEQKPSQTEIAEVLESLIDVSKNDSSLVDAYRENEFQPVWTQSGGLKKVAENYLEALDEVVFDGLEKTDYLTEELAQLIEASKKSKDPMVLATLDLAMSKSFLTLASDLNIGKIDPGKLNIEWKMDRKIPTEKYSEVLLAIAGGESPEKSLANLRPDNSEYNKLREQLRKLIAEPLVDSLQVKNFEGKIEQGDQHEAIPSIRKKLAFWQELKSEGTGNVYSEDMFKAVTHFQKRHGLIDDGVIGGDFIEAINYGQADLITKIKVNLERWRWLPDFTENDKDKVIVNIPDFRLFYIQKSDTILTSKVIVGKDYRQTPVFKSDMTYLVLSPTWTLPETILWEDAIPSIQKDISYLDKHQMKVLDFDGNEVNAKKINWKSLKSKGDFPYMIRQSPGKLNPLGQVKFMFPNDYSIYIHDSPAQSLFSQDERTFSSGCIRMEKPKEFAELLLAETDDWDASTISDSMNLEQEKNVSLKKSQEVWILYVSVWDIAGNVAVRKDVYEMDKKLAAAMSLPVSTFFL
ncbi:hypothetical protein P872_07305 [Rhodonellum psychrophilum GCM71 = DSM 17998]|uniref:L,D-TPase catalytic domain-containing protein n=2 Tax=Rhodonellum TaxID=336827 RepID=U5BZU8_9BACT|nr:MULTISPECIES: L,D-transpeptidase family protein [Rhodonellum]ERM82206.1 hypothetical protein P872_07305 [Rhodonellum psychrophilum GCM71 = DSM 17998]MDO9551521.1 L,D-transpeptidase family protein [Rhodonellum sp.]SDZ40983.1 Murein L,D-transpeptidase YcbB/YkuD [Rhodonellum ikkaensis]